MNLNFNGKTIGEIAAALPEATQIFRENKIDFCCGGHRLLNNVIQEQGLNQNHIYGLLEKAYADRKESSAEKNYTDFSPKQLIIHIEDEHHGYLRENLPVLSGLMTTVLKAHGKNHPELYNVYKLFGNLKSDLEQHLIKEEALLFPLLSENSQDDTEIFLLIKELTDEHEAAGEILRTLRKLTNDYSVPEDACPTFQKAYRLFTEIEQDLFEHIHLENNVLFKNHHSKFVF